jgi:hypothetical protein
MNTLLPSFLCLLITVGCSAPRPGRVFVLPHPNPVAPDHLSERVRYPELVKAYHMARYVDPNHRLLMHEAHTVYRVEGQATWNLRSSPGGFVLPSAVGTLTNAAVAPPPFNDAVVAELNQQRAITRAVTQQAQSLNHSIQEFSAALSTNRSLVEQNRLLREQLSRIEQRLRATESQLKQRATSAPETQ